MVIVEGNEHSNTNSNPGREKYESNYSHSRHG